MFNLGMSELIVIFVLALLLIGPKQLPEVARVLGRLLSEIKKAFGDLSQSVSTVQKKSDDFFRQTAELIEQKSQAPPLEKGAGESENKKADEKDNEKGTADDPAEALDH